MAYDGTLKFDTALDSSGFQEGTSKLNDIVKGLGVFKLLEKGFQAVAASVDAAVSRYDTLNNFPKIMQKMGYSAEESAAATQKLSDGIQGLPTTLDGITASTKQLVIATGGLDKGVETALSLNNAFLASGASSEDAARGLVQYTQMLSSGKVDAQSWRALNETMTYALQKTAEAFGFAGASAKNGLYAALSSGQITFTQFNDKIIELNKGVGGFAEVAKTSTGGIGTAWTNLHTAVVRGTTGIVSAIDKGLSTTRFVSIENTINSMKNGILNSLGLVATAFGIVAQNAEVLIPAVTAGVGAFMLYSNVITPIINVSKAIKETNALILANEALTVGDAQAHGLLTVALANETIAKKVRNTVSKQGMTIDAAGNLITEAGTAATLKETIAVLSSSGAISAKSIVVALLTKQIGLATAAQLVWNMAVNSFGVGGIIAAGVAVVAAVAAIIAATKKGSAAYENEKKKIEEVSEAHEKYREQLEKDKEASQKSQQEKQSEIKTNLEVVQSLQKLIDKNDEAGKQNHNIVSTVGALNASMEGLGLAYDSTTGKLNMTNDELLKYAKNLEAVTDHQMQQSEYNRLLQEQYSVQQQIDAQEAKRSEYGKMRQEGLITEKEYIDLFNQGEQYLAKLFETQKALTLETEAAGRAAEAAYNAEAEAAVKAIQIRNTQMDEIKNYAELWMWTADEVIDSASRMAGGLEELAAQQAKLFTDTGRDVNMLSEIYGQSADDINKWVEDTGKTLDDYVKWAEKNLTEEGLTVEQLAEKWNVSAESIQRDVRKSEQSVQEWEKAQQEALDAVREYASEAGKSYEQIAAEAEKASMSVNDYVAYQKGALTSSGMDIEQVATYWRVTVDEVKGHMAKYKVSLDQANKDLEKMRTKSGKTLAELATILGKTTNQVEADAAAMGLSWQDYGDTQEKELEEAEKKIQEYAKTYKMSADEVRAGIAAMGGDVQLWQIDTERAIRAASVAEQAYVDQIKAGNVEINASYVEGLEARRQNGGLLNAIEQATLDQWNAINQAAAEKYKAQQQGIVDASEAGASKIVLSKQQSAKKILEIQAANNKTTAEYVNNYNAIYEKIPEEQRKILEGMGIEDARLLKDIAGKWEKGGKELWEKYVAGIEESEATAAKLAGDKAGTLTDSTVSLSEDVQEVFRGMTTQVQTTMQAMMTDINTAVTDKTDTVKASATTLGDGVMAALTEMKTQGVSIVQQMMTGINSEITDSTSTVKASADSVSDEVVKGLSPMISAAKDVADKMMDGVGTAMDNKAPSLYKKAKEIADKIAKTMATALDVHSPSRVMIKLFNNVMMGVYNGMDGMKGKLYNEAGRISDGITDRLTVSPDTIRSYAGQLQAMTQSNQLGGVSMIAQRVAADTMGAATGEAIDYDKLADAVSKRPVSIFLDGEKVGEITEPTVSQKQGSRYEATIRSGYDGVLV